MYYILPMAHVIPVPHSKIMHFFIGYQVDINYLTKQPATNAHPFLFYFRLTIKHLETVHHYTVMCHFTTVEQVLGYVSLK
jgi:hypothetical protein